MRKRRSMEKKKRNRQHCDCWHESVLQKERKKERRALMFVVCVVRVGVLSLAIYGKLCC